MTPPLVVGAAVEQQPHRQRQHARVVGVGAVGPALVGRRHEALQLAEHRVISRAETVAHPLGTPSSPAVVRGRKHERMPRVLRESGQQRVTQEPGAALRAARAARAGQRPGARGRQRRRRELGRMGQPARRTQSAGQLRLVEHDAHPAPGPPAASRPGRHATEVGARRRAPATRACREPLAATTGHPRSKARAVKACATIEARSVPSTMHRRPPAAGRAAAADQLLAHRVGQPGVADEAVGAAPRAGAASRRGGRRPGRRRPRRAGWWRPGAARRRAGRPGRPAADRSAAARRRRRARGRGCPGPARCAVSTRSTRCRAGGPARLRRRSSSSCWAPGR